MTADTARLIAATEALDEARSAYTAFVEAWGRVGEEVRRLAPHTHRRVEVYPGWDGIRDAGGMMSLTDWMAEVAQALVDAADLAEGDVPCGECAMYTGTDEAPPPHDHPDGQAFDPAAFMAATDPEQLAARIADDAAEGRA